MPTPVAPHLVVLAQRDGWEDRYQVSALAAATAAAGREVAICLFFGALDAWVQGRWDDLDPEPPLTVERLERAGFPPLTSLLESGREEGLICVYGCSASVRLMGLDLATVQESVNAILGWQSFARMVAEAQRTLVF